MVVTSYAGWFGGNIFAGHGPALSTGLAATG